MGGLVEGVREGGRYCGPLRMALHLQGAYICGCRCAGAGVCVCVCVYAYMCVCVYVCVCVCE